MTVKELKALLNGYDDNDNVKLSYEYDAIETVTEDISTVGWDGTDVILRG